MAGMRFLVLLCLASCAHDKQIKFTDNSEENKVGWVCVPEGEDWSCVSVETFSKYLRKSQHSDM